MCKWAATLIVTAQCKNYTKPEGPHQYQDREIWPCHYAKKIRSSPDVWEPCDDFVGRNGETVEQGSFSNRPCPVCRTLEDAQEEYEEALRVAEMRYQRAIAYSTMITHYRFDKPRHRN